MKNPPLATTAIAYQSCISVALDATELTLRNGKGAGSCIRGLEGWRGMCKPRVVWRRASSRGSTRLLGIFDHLAQLPEDCCETLSFQDRFDGCGTASGRPISLELAGRLTRYPATCQQLQQHGSSPSPSRNGGPINIVTTARRCPSTVQDQRPPLCVFYHASSSWSPGQLRRPGSVADASKHLRFSFNP